MNLKTKIRKVLKESSFNQSLKKAIDSQGLYTTMQLTSLSFIQIISKIGLEWVTEKIMLDFIHQVMSKVLPSFGLSEVGEEPIFYGRVGPEIRNIVFLGSTRVIIEVFNDSTGSTDGEFSVSYYNLSDDLLKEVFDVIVRVHDENIEI